MDRGFRAARHWLARGSNQIALSTAVRGMVSTAAPLVVLPVLGYPELGHFAVLGALGISMVDVGGPYRRRLAAMAIASGLGPCLLLVGLAVGNTWPAAALIMAALAIGSGLVRAFGPGGVSFGINMSVAFLIGVGAGAFGVGDALVWAGGYLCGAVWTIVVTLAFWQARPYRRLEQEVAAAWQAVADLVTAVRPEPDGDTVTAVGRRRREQMIVSRHRAAREAIERAHDVLGETRSELAGPGTTMAQLIVLVASASRVGAAALTLEETSRVGEGSDGLAAALREIMQRLEDEARAAAAALLGRRAEIDVEVLRRSVASHEGQLGGPTAPTMLALAQAVRNLANAEEALRFLGGRRRGGLFPVPFPLRSADPARLADPVRRHVDPNSPIFRHALRIAAVTAPATAAVVKFDLPHGIWLPLTILVVLQPDYGGTLRRALQRSAGTVVGAVIAGILLVGLHSGTAVDAAIAALLFATFFLIRRHYGQAIAFLTPLIILLVGFSSADPWADVGDRVLYTVAGAATAIIAGYVLWPRWEHEQLPARLAAALQAARAYLGALLDALARAPPPAGLGPLRRAAEVEVTNLEAAFERMNAEPSRQRGRIGRLFMLTVYIHRLCRHTIALEMQLGAAPAPGEIVAPLRRLADEALANLADALASGTAPAPRPPFDEPLARVRAAIGRGSGADSGADRLLDQIVSDLTALNAAAAALAAAPP